MNRLSLVGALLVAVVAVGAVGCTSPAPLDASTMRSPEVGPPTISVVVLAGDDLSELTADISVEGAAVTVSDDGTPVFVWPGHATTIEVSAPGFQTESVDLDDPPHDGRVEFRIEPTLLSGRVSTDRGVALPGVEVVLGDVRDITNDDGLFEIVRAVPGDLQLSRPAWQDAAVPWDGTTDAIDTTMEPITVHGIRVGGTAAGDPEHWQRLLSLADESGINAFVVDIKDEFGTVFYDTTVEAAHEASAITLQYDLGQIVSDMEDHDLYKIARVVAFQDTPMATVQPDHAVLEEGSGSLWLTRNGEAWMDPTDPVSFEYPVALAEEACKAGFDEIQFDFASFPFGGDVSTAVFDDAYTEEVRVGSIQAFLKRAYSVLNPRPLECAVGANVLGITLESGTDEGVGQLPGLMSRTIDVLSPMLYSTNYGPGWKGFENPNDHAAEIVDAALVGGLSRLEGFAYYRPWLQTWKLPAFELRSIQRSVDERVNGWMLWSNSASYTLDILPPR